MFILHKYSSSSGTVDHPQSSFNTELNDLRKIICLRKTKAKFLLKEFQFIKSLEFDGAWQTLSAMLHQIFNDFILSAMLLHQWRHRFVTIATTALLKCFSKPLSGTSSR